MNEWFAVVAFYVAVLLGIEIFLTRVPAEMRGWAICAGGPIVAMLWIWYKRRRRSR